MKNCKIEIKWAVIFTIMTFAWSVIGKLLGFHDNGIANNLLFNTLIIIPSIVIYILAIREKRTSFYQGSMTYKQGLVSGLILTLFITISGPLNPIFGNIISPDLFKNSIQFVVSNNIMTEAEAIKQFNLPAFIIQGIIGALLFGAVYSLVLAAFIQKKVAR